MISFVSNKIQIFEIMKAKLTLLSFLLIVLAGCSSAPYKKLTTSYNANNNEGMIVGTICLESKTYRSYTFEYKDVLPSISDYGNVNGQFSVRNAPGDFKERRKIYFLFTVVKPAGKYKFSKIKIYDNTRHEQMLFDIPLEMNFEIEKGKTTYFGQLTVNTKKKKYTVENKLDRDKTWFAQKLPQIQLQ